MTLIKHNAVPALICHMKLLSFNSAAVAGGLDVPVEKTTSHWEGLENNYQIPLDLELRIWSLTFINEVHHLHSTLIPLGMTHRGSLRGLEHVQCTVSSHLVGSRDLS